MNFPIFKKKEIPRRTVILGVYITKMGLKIPIIKAWRYDWGQVVFYCEHCKCFHHHGYARGFPNGHRCAHCNKPNSPFSESGYILQVEEEKE
jgi:hypothetical protein